MNYNFDLFWYKTVIFFQIISKLFLNHSGMVLPLRRGTEHPKNLYSFFLILLLSVSLNVIVQTIFWLSGQPDNRLFRTLGVSLNVTCISSGFRNMAQSVCRSNPDARPQSNSLIFWFCRDVGNTAHSTICYTKQDARWVRETFNTTLYNDCYRAIIRPRFTTSTSLSLTKWS